MNWWNVSFELESSRCLARTRTRSTHNFDTENFEAAIPHAGLASTGSAASAIPVPPSAGGRAAPTRGTLFRLSGDLPDRLAP